MNRISEITKRDILDLLRNGIDIEDFFETKKVIYCYFGCLEEIDFLRRLYNLKKMPSADSRFLDAEGDIEDEDTTVYLISKILGNGENDRVDGESQRTIIMSYTMGALKEQLISGEKTN